MRFWTVLILSFFATSTVWAEALILHNEYYIDEVDIKNLGPDYISYKKNNKIYQIKQTFVVEVSDEIPFCSAELTGSELDYPEMVVNYKTKEYIAVLPPLVELHKLDNKKQFRSDPRGSQRTRKYLEGEFNAKMTANFNTKVLSPSEKDFGLGRKDIRDLFNQINSAKGTYEDIYFEDALDEYTQKREHKYILLIRHRGYSVEDPDAFEKESGEFVAQHSTLIIMKKHHPAVSVLEIAVVDRKTSEVVLYDKSEFIEEPTRFNIVGHQVDILIDRIRNKLL
jgi:hypothetical protein